MIPGTLPRTWLTRWWYSDRCNESRHDIAHSPVNPNAMLIEYCKSQNGTSHRKINLPEIRLSLEPTPEQSWVMGQIRPSHLGAPLELCKLIGIRAHGRRNRHWDSSRRLLLLAGLRRVVGRQSVGTSKVEGLASGGGGAGAVNVDFLWSDSTMGADHASGDPLGGVAENVVLEATGEFMRTKRGNGSWRSRLTVKMLTTPKTSTTMPEEITMRQKASPSDCSLVAVLLRFPRMPTPTTIIRNPRVTKPEEMLRRGQFRA